MKPFTSPYGVPGTELELAVAAKQDCPTCVVHAAASLSLHGVACPACGTRLKIHNAAEEVVGEHLGEAYHQRYVKVPVIDCQNCGLLVALWPVPVNHEPQHDVLYLGGVSVHPGSCYKHLLNYLVEVVRPSIAQFLSQYRRNKSLKAESLIATVAALAAGVVADNLKAAGVLPGEHKISQAEADVILGAASQVCPNGCAAGCYHDKARMLAAIYKILPKEAPKPDASIRAV